MVAADFLQDPRVQGWLDGVEPAWTLLTFESLLALRHEPSAVQSAIQIANDLSVGEIAGSPVARNTLILLGQAIERVGLSLTATGNLTNSASAFVAIAAKVGSPARSVLYERPADVPTNFPTKRKLFAVVRSRPYQGWQTVVAAAPPPRNDHGRLSSNEFCRHSAHLRLMPPASARWAWRRSPPQRPAVHRSQPASARAPNRPGARSETPGNASRSSRARCRRW
jgi:hypothetical protein